MKTLSVIIRNYTTPEGRTFTGAKAKGVYLPPDVEGIDPETNYLVKIARKASGAFPVEEGVYSVTCTDGWLDKRETTIKPTFWLGGEIVFVKKHDLKKFAD